MYKKLQLQNPLNSRQDFRLLRLETTLAELNGSKTVSVFTNDAMIGQVKFEVTFKYNFDYFIGSKGQSVKRKKKFFISTTEII